MNTTLRFLLAMGLAIVLAGFLVAYKVFVLTPPKDVDGNRPEDVARMFVAAVQVGDFEKAAACWRTGDVRNVEANSDMTFKDFCTEYFRCDTYELNYTGRDKKTYIVDLRGQKGGTPKTFGLCLQRIDGRWRLVMEQFMPDSTQSQTETSR